MSKAAGFCTWPRCSADSSVVGNIETDLLADRYKEGFAVCSRSSPRQGEKIEYRSWCSWPLLRANMRRME